MSQLHRAFSVIPENIDLSSTPVRLLERGVMAVIFAMLALGLHRAFIANINWDEFYFLSLVHLYQNGTLTAPLQTIHVHLFGWLPLISDDEIHQIFAARVFVWFLSVASCWLIYDIARKFCSKEAALFPVLFYLGFSYVMDHGLSFRADPLCAALFLASLYLLLDPNRSQFRTALSAALMSAAIMVSIKSVFYLATIGPILLILITTEPVKRGAGLRVVVYAFSALLTLFVLYQFHSSSLSNASVADAGAAMMGAGNKTLLSGHFFPRAYYIVRAFSENPLVWLFVLLGIVAASYDALRDTKRREALFLIVLTLPLLSLVIYRNAFPYFYVFLMPAVIIPSGVFADVLITRFRKAGTGVLIGIFSGIVLLISASFVTDYMRKLPNQTIAQRETVAAIHSMYTEPVPYIDRNSMISSFPKVGFFMSSWGMENYRAKNSPVMERLIRSKHPRFLIANHCALDIGSSTNRRCRHRLLDADFETLRSNFVHHWGPLYVVGKTVSLPTSGARQPLDILVSGIYTIEAGAAVSIDGITYQPGAQISLDQAVHTIAATDTATAATLRLGTTLYKPSHKPSAQEIYFKF